MGNTLCPGPSLWRLVLISLRPDCIALHLEPTRKAVACPMCGQLSARVHSRYRRKARDLPWAQWQVVLIVYSRKFFCDNDQCPRRIFTEPFPGILERYSRRTERLHKSVVELSYASSAEAAARAAESLGYRVSGDTLLNWQRQEQFTCPTPRVLGVDEFSLKRGHTYGTILVDLERHEPVDVLEGREAGPLTTWLQSHPGVEIVSRDRSESYAQAARTGAPNAVQVADRFHLVRNVGEAFKKLLSSRRWKAPPTDCASEDTEVHPKPSDELVEEPSPKSPGLRKLAMWEIVKEERTSGKSFRAIARELGISRRTVRKYSGLDHPPVYRRLQPPTTKLYPYVAYLRKRWLAGCHNAKLLADELREHGYDGGYTQIKDLVRPWRTKASSAASTRRPVFRPWLAIRPYARLNATDKQVLGSFLAVNPDLAKSHSLKERFGHIMSTKDVSALNDWLTDATESGLKPFESVARGMQKDIDAIRMALTLRWSNAQCEGQNCRVKMIKRQGYGRAKFDLLRQRILHRARVA